VEDGEENKAECGISLKQAGMRNESTVFLGAFAKFRKYAIGFVMSICSSVRPHGTTRVPLDGFSLNFDIPLFSEINLTRMMATLLEDLFTFVIIARSFLLSVRNVSDKCYSENKNTHFMLISFFPPKIMPFLR